MSPSLNLISPNSPLAGTFNIGSCKIASSRFPRSIARQLFQAMLRALSRCIAPGAGGPHRCPPAGPVPEQPPGTGLPLFGGLVTRHREAVSARWPHGPSSTPPTVPWPGRRAYLGRYSPALYLATHSSTLQSRSADSFCRIGTRLRQPYTSEETRILCPICRVPEISRRAHQDGSLHRSRLLAATTRDTTPGPPQPPPAPTTVEAAVALLRSARPDLLAQGALTAPTSVPPPNLSPQPPVDDPLDFDE